MLTKWTLRDCVHLERRWTLPSKLQSLPKAESPRSHLSRQRRSIADKRRIVEETLVARRVGSEGGAGAWGERQPGVWLASALPGGKTGGAEAGDEVVAGSGE